MKHAYNHDYMITLDELPVFSNRNVMPHARIVWPEDGVAIETTDLDLAGFASDRNGNLSELTLYALSEPWLNIKERGGNNARLANPSVEALFAAGVALGKPRIGARGRWTFIWKDLDAPPVHREGSGDGHGHLLFMATAESLAARLRSPTGYAFRIVDDAGEAPSGSITIRSIEADERFGEEGYRLRLMEDGVLLEAPAKAGMFYGMQTFLQLLSAEVRR